MSEATRRKIAQLRALAASTTFPAEAESARAKADQLEAELLGSTDEHAIDALAYALGGLGGGPYTSPFQPAEARARMQARWQRMFDEAMGRTSYGGVKK